MRKRADTVQYKPGDLVKSYIPAIDIPVYRENPMVKLRADIEAGEDEFKITANEMMRLTGNDIAVVITLDDQFLFVNVRDRMGWVLANFVRLA